MSDTNLSLRIVADENIPFAQTALEGLGTVRTLPGRAITPADVRDADALLVRSVTQVDAALLANSTVQFVGSATIGTDHVDGAYLGKRGIAFAHAPGSNAESVVEYVLAALLRFSVTRGEALRGKVVGIVGCGHIGGRLAERLPALGLRVLKNDPPLAAKQGGGAFVGLADVLREADVVTLHVPLTRRGAHATYHLIGEEELAQQHKEGWLINASRGPIVDGVALEAARASRRPSALVLDVWEGEPTPDPDLLRRTHLATPHIAGYSYDGKVQGTVMLYDALTAQFGLPKRWDVQAAFAPSPEDHLTLDPPDPALSETAWLDALVQQMYAIEADDARLRDMLAKPAEAHAAHFTDLRKRYPRRRAFSRHTLAAESVPEPYRRAVEEGLRVRLV
ncbi:MAG: 4-phosphoerythronate dehydrogenase [Rhodothermales bacterium]